MKKILPVLLLIIFVSCNKEQEITPVEDPVVLSDSQSVSEPAGESAPVSDDRTAGEVSPDESSAEISDTEPEPEKNVQDDTKDGYKMITWWDLISKPEITYYKDLNAEFEADPAYSPTTDPPAPGINPDINSLKICIPGFIVGVDSDPDNFAMVNTFLFVPYQGACIHVPPPPTNQTVFVTVDEPFQSNPYAPYWLYGTIYTEEGNNDIAAYSYTLKGDKLEIYN